MSRRLQTTEVQRLLAQMEDELAKPESGGYVTLVDGKPLVVGNYSRDREATWGHSRRGFAKGYKLHAIYGKSPVPLAWEVTGLNEGEPTVAARLVFRVKRHGGYLLADSNYDSNPLHEATSCQGFQLVADRHKSSKGKGLGHRRHHAGRLRSIEILSTAFGRQLYRNREQVERHFGWLTNHAAGLAPLPNWVRRIHRVRQWIQAKILIHAVYQTMKLHNQPLAELAVA